MKRLMKHTLGQLLATTGLYRQYLRDKAIIVLFHRVDSRLKGDALTATEEEFEEWCRFFKDRFTVVGVSELLGKVRRREPIGLHLAITFDDGYLDNATVAAPLLRQLGLPGCFYVATEFIESERVPWWDEGLPVKPEWMTWEQVRDLHDQGFEIGSHTMNHVDMGQVDQDEAERELAGARDRLRKELGVDVPLFSYPYGRRDNISPENLTLVRRAGYESCMSAHGGFVTADTDLFNVKRVPISRWFTSPYQFLWEASNSARHVDRASLRWEGGDKIPS